MTSIINGNLVARKVTDTKTESRLAYVMLSTVVVLWGGSIVASKFIVGDLPPFTVGGIRTVLALAVLIFLMMRKEGLLFPQWRDWPMLFALGISGIFLCNAITYLALQYTSATNCALIAALCPIVITVISTFVLREKITLWQVTGIILSFLGVVVVITKGSWNILINMGFNVGDVIMLGNPICYGLYTVLTKKAVNRYSPLVLVTYAHLIACMFFVPFVIYELNIAWSRIQVSAVDVGTLVYLGILGASIATLLWNKGIERVGASRAGIFMNAVPVSTMLLSAVLLGEKITLNQILGSAMVIIGVYLNSIRSRSNLNIS